MDWTVPGDAHGANRPETRVAARARYKQEPHGRGGLTGPRPFPGNSGAAGRGDYSHQWKGLLRQQEQAKRASSPNPTPPTITANDLHLYTAYRPTVSL